MTDGCMVCGLRTHKAKKTDEVITRCGWCANPIVVRCGKCRKIIPRKLTRPHSCSKGNTFRSEAGTPNKWGKRGISAQKLNTDLGLRARKRDYAAYWFPEEEQDEENKEDYE